MAPRKTALIGLAAACLLGLWVDSSHAQGVSTKPHFGVAILYDGDSERMAARQQNYVDELLTLVSGEFDITIEVFRGNWTKESIEQAMLDAYNSPQIDMLLVQASSLISWWRPGVIIPSQHSCQPSWIPACYPTRHLPAPPAYPI